MTKPKPRQTNKQPPRNNQQQEPPPPAPQEDQQMQANINQPQQNERPPAQEPPPPAQEVAENQNDKEESEEEEEQITKKQSGKRITGTNARLELEQFADADSHPNPAFWMKAFELQSKAKYGDSDEHIISTFPYYLKGDARNWFFTIKPEPTTFKELKEMFLETYTKERSSITEFANIRFYPKGDFRVYVDRKLQAGRNAKLTEQQIIGLIIPTLDLKLQQQLTIMNPKTVNELKEYGAKIVGVTRKEYHQKHGNYEHKQFNDRTFYANQTKARPPAPCSLCGAWHWISDCKHNKKNNSNGGKYPYADKKQGKPFNKGNYHNKNNQNNQKNM